jgi:hypothetical protein
MCSNFVRFHLLPSPRPHHRPSIRRRPHLPPPVVDCYIPPFLCFFFLFSLYFERNRLCFNFGQQFHSVGDEGGADNATAEE